MKVTGTDPPRPFEGIFSHIRVMLGRMDELEDIVGKQVCAEVKKAVKHIQRTKHCNILPEDVVRTRFQVELKDL